MSNSVDPDETAHHEPSHLDLCCLQKPLIIAYGSEGVNMKSESDEEKTDSGHISGENNMMEAFRKLWLKFDDVRFLGVI